MQLVRLVKASDTSELTKLIKKAGIGMTTMPKNRKEVEEGAIGATRGMPMHSESDCGGHGVQVRFASMCGFTSIERTREDRIANEVHLYERL